MDIGEAYRLFQISDRTIDDDSILAAYQVFASEDPAQIEVFQTALRVIANETQSLLLKAALGEDITPSDLDLNEWPVGLRNIGNTCYLNSLLQFYFTIKPFREMVLHFEDRKMEVDEESINRKKVGSRTVSRAEVERAQKCMVFSLYHFGGTIKLTCCFSCPRVALIVRRHDQISNALRNARTGTCAINLTQLFKRGRNPA